MSQNHLLPFVLVILIATPVVWAGDGPTLALAGLDPVALCQGCLTT